MNRAQTMLLQSHTFDHRQLAVLAHATQHPDASHTGTSHANGRHVTRQTARADLKELAADGLLLSTPVANGFVHAVPADLEGRLEDFGREEGARPAGGEDGLCFLGWPRPRSA